MSVERRRYFRINETIGLSYEPLEEGAGGAEPEKTVPDVLSLLSEQDKTIEKLLLEVAEESPKVAQLITEFNLKLERIVNHLTLEGKLLGRIAERVKEVNISACGMAFVHDEQVPAGTALSLELTLFPEEKVVRTNGRVVACDPAGQSGDYYWRIDFFAMKKTAQEELIQHIVKSQSSQLKTLRDR